MADGGELAAFFRGAQDGVAGLVDDTGKLLGDFDNETAQNVLDSVATIVNADGASADAIRGVGKDLDDAPEDLAGSGPPADGGGEPNQIERLLGDDGDPGHQATFGHTDSFDYKKTFFDANPDTEGKVVVHHAVEQQAMRRYPDAGITPNEMHSLENLRGIPKGDVNDRVHLSLLRKEWNRFYRDNPNPTKEDFLKFATKMDKQYGHEFNPPIR